ncbi:MULTISPECIES: cytidine deaminase [unclassified Halomonas]|uniref:cytidine deaminase n=1 Tax=unclassified Halomonas TaxID=2609666 RepID=UPI0007D9446C|nr:MULTISPECIES: cytidine deaminase [unclassified Halomonas]MBT2785258.1 cytidine deaminase [Halomonas sp. ISL-106]MBT2799279.1 cytidine deaminase [Halomonas sp. ISL-104]OAL59543.1 cytidine deaminase [Halomonas sp. ALS9]
MSQQTDEVSAEIVEQLFSARANAYVPYSAHPVASVMVTPDGQQFAGTNVEVAHYKGLCAEASAISAMITAGQRQLATVYVMGPGDHLCTPCGDCRQRIREFATPETQIKVLSGSGKLMKTYSMEALLPDGFGPEQLPPR